MPRQGDLSVTYYEFFPCLRPQQLSRRLSTSSIDPPASSQAITLSRSPFWAASPISYVIAAGRVAFSAAQMMLKYSLKQEARALAAAPMTLYAKKKPQLDFLSFRARRRRASAAKSKCAKPAALTLQLTSTPRRRRSRRPPRRPRTSGSAATTTAPLRRVRASSAARSGEGAGGLRRRFARASRARPSSWRLSSLSRAVAACRRRPTSSAATDHQHGHHAPAR